MNNEYIEYSRSSQFGGEWKGKGEHYWGIKLKHKIQPECNELKKQVCHKMHFNLTSLSFVYSFDKS